MKAVHSAGLVLVLLAGAAARAAADRVALRNGVALEGILEPGSGGSRTLLVSTDGFVVLDSATVVAISTASAAENARLRARWAADDARAAARERAARLFAAARRREGLIPLDGEWVTPAEYDRRVAREKPDPERERAAPPPAARVLVTVNEAAPLTVMRRFRPRRLRRFRDPDEGVRSLFPASASGNFIRRSEFAGPGSPFGRGGLFFDRETGLYR
jgi:hypothetical protein